MDVRVKIEGNALIRDRKAYYNGFLEKNVIEEFVIPDGITKIGEEAFYSSDSLTSLTIPESVTEIGFLAFSGCARFAKIKLHPDDEFIEFCYYHDEEDYVILGEYNDVNGGNSGLETAVQSAINMLRSGDYSEEDPYSVTLVLMLQRYMRTKEEKLARYISRHLYNLMSVCAGARVGKTGVIEALTKTDGILTADIMARSIEIAVEQNKIEHNKKEIVLELLNCALIKADDLLTADNIDRFIDIAAEYEQHEIMIELMQYKDKRLGFKTPTEKLVF